MKMTISAATLAAALLVTTMAWANHPQSKASGAYAHSPLVSPNVRAANPRASSPHDVFSYEGEYIGRDPDPNIRLQLLRDYQWKTNG